MDLSDKQQSLTQETGFRVSEKVILIHSRPEVLPSGFEMIVSLGNWQTVWEQFQHINLYGKDMLMSLLKTMAKVCCYTAPRRRQRETAALTSGTFWLHLGRT